MTEERDYWEETVWLAAEAFGADRECMACQKVVRHMIRREHGTRCAAHGAKPTTEQYQAPGVRQPLSARQAMVLDFIRESVSRDGFPPTIREIGSALGINSTNGVADHLKILERKGYLARSGGRSRAIMLVDGVDDELRKRIAQLEAEVDALRGRHADGDLA